LFKKLVKCVHAHRALILYSPVDFCMLDIT